MRQRKYFDTEADMAAVVVEWLKAQGWQIFQEVQLKFGGSIADIAAQKADDVLVVEAKLQVGLAVLAQAHQWTRHADQVAIAVPHIALRTRPFIQAVCQSFGIGLWLVHAPLYAPGHRLYSPGRVTEIVQARRSPGGSTDQLRQALIPERQDYAPAGNAEGKRYTPFAATRDQLIRLVQEKPGLSIAEAVEALPHHYRTVNSARQSLLFWVKHGKIKGVAAKKTAGTWWLYPTEVPMATNPIAAP